jgi:SAM-dependent methyltransferase
MRTLDPPHCARANAVRTNTRSPGSCFKVLFLLKKNNNMIFIFMLMNELSTVEEFIRAREPIDVYEVKAIDRRLSRPFIKPNFIVCDIGGGYGIDVLPFAELSSRSILLEINFRVFESVRSTAKGLGLDSRMDFIMASTLYLPYRKGVFDLVSSFSVLDHVPGEDSHHKAIREMSRVARDFGYVIVTVPNKFFIIGTITRKMIQFMENPFLEIHFTPKEIRESMMNSGLTPLLFDVKYPTIIRSHVINHHFPNFVKKIPQILLIPFIHICEKVFGRLEKGCFKIFGARMGYLCQKKGCVRAAHEIELNTFDK